VWEVATRKELHRVETPRGYRSTAEFALPTQDLATRYIPIEKSKVVRFERNEKKQVRSEHTGNVSVWDLTTGKQLPSLETTSPGRGVLVAYLSPCDDKLVAVERPSYTRGEEPNDLTVLHDLKAKTITPLGDGYGMAAFSADGKTLVVCLFATKDQPGRLKVIDLATGKERFSATTTAKGRGFSWPIVSPNGKLVAVIDSGGRIDSPATMRLFDLQTGKEAAAFESGGKYPFTNPAFSPDSNRLAATDYNGGLTVWDLAGKKVEQTRTYPDMWVQHATFGPDGKTLAVLAQAKSDRERGEEPDLRDRTQPRVFLFDLVNSEKKPNSLVCPHGWNGGVAFSPDGKLLAVGGAGAVHLFDLTKR
jgi:WD40 repeat protein